MWKKEGKQCFIIDISVGLDVNVTKNFHQKHDKYLPLTAELKRLYGATGLVTNDLKLMLK